MTDVLEQLLKESEEDESEWEEIWSSVRLAALTREPFEATDIHAPQSQSASQAEQPRTERDADWLDEKALSMGAFSYILDGIRVRQEAVWSISDRMTRLHKAAQRRERQSVHSEGIAGPASGHDALLVRGVAQQTPHTADYAALVDAVFARDARRYDGALRLL